MAEKDNKTMTGTSRKHRLSQLGTERRPGNNRLYSRYVRLLRLVLPLIAIGIIALIMTWPRIEDTMEPIKKEAVVPLTVGKNEVISPRFESRDEKQQPYRITADIAVQSPTDQDIVFLEKPAADITLNSGAWLAVKADKGAYRQHDERLLLEGTVEIFHDAGYRLLTEKMLVNLQTGKVFSETPVRASGPAGTLNAVAMEGNNTDGLLIFKGPVKLVLNRKIKGL